MDDKSTDLWIKSIHGPKFRKMVEDEQKKNQHTRMKQIFSCLQCKREKSCLNKNPTVPLPIWYELGRLILEYGDTEEDPMLSPEMAKLYDELSYPFCDIDCDYWYHYSRKIMKKIR